MNHSLFSDAGKTPEVSDALTMEVRGAAKTSIYCFIRESVQNA